MNLEFILSVGIASWFIRTAARQFNKRVLGRGIRMTLPSGTVFSIPKESRIGSAVFVTDADVDWGSEALLARLASRDTGFIDVGANIGYYSAYMASGFSFVYAFEPDNRAYRYLSLLERSLPNLKTFNVAASDTDGAGSLIYGPCSDVSALGNEPGAGTPVQTRTLDSFLPTFSSRIGAIKIDTEGHELAVLAGADALIAQDRPLILLETPIVSPIVEWARQRRYSIGAACRIKRIFAPSFRWFTRPDSARVKMVLLAPAESVPLVTDVVGELYGSPAKYRRSLKRFRARTRELRGSVS